MTKDELKQEIKDLFARYGATGEIPEARKQIIDTTLDHLLRNVQIGFVDADKIMWDRICTAARYSSWIPPDYMMNDWVADVEHWLRHGSRKNHG